MDMKFLKICIKIVFVKCVIRKLSHFSKSVISEEEEIENVVYIYLL